MQIVNPPYSFIQFNEASAPAIPVCNDNDIMFHVSALCGTIAEANNLMDNINVKLYVVKANIAINTPADLGPATVLLDLTWVYLQKYRVEAKKVVLFWPNGLTGMSTFSPEQCSRICLVIGEQVAVSNLLKKVDNEFSSVVEYACEEDSFGFSYCADPSVVNRVRIPLFLKAPQFVDSEQVYFFSNGKSKILNSITKKEYACHVDYCTEDLHEKIKVALSHDWVKIESDVYSGGITKNGGYQIEWPDLPGYSKMAKAELSVFATPYLLRNSNCSTCGGDAACNPAMVESALLADAVINEPYIATLSILGDGPFVLELITKPSWMAIAIVGSQVVITGNPTVLAEASPISFNVVNCGGTAYDAVVDAVAVVPLCIPVAFVGTIIFNPAVVGDDYTYDIELAGTPPFSLSAILKPGWMSVSLSGNHIIIGGTPTAASTDTPVQLTVTNCGGEISVIDTIDVVEAEEP